ncbi:unnamed protein product, partial [Prorocentrum cordatum]
MNRTRLALTSVSRSVMNEVSGIFFSILQISSLCMAKHMTRNDIKLSIDGDITKYGEMKVILSRLAKQPQAQDSPDQYDGYWVDLDDDYGLHYGDYDGYDDYQVGWQSYDDEYWEEADHEYDESHDQDSDGDVYKSSGKKNPGKRGSTLRNTPDCPAATKFKGPNAKDQHDQDTPYDKKPSKGKGK